MKAFLSKYKLAPRFERAIQSYIFTNQPKYHGLVGPTIRVSFAEGDEDFDKDEISVVLDAYTTKKTPHGAELRGSSREVKETSCCGKPELDPSIKDGIGQLSQNRGRTDKIITEDLVSKAVQKLSDFGFERNKFMLEKVIEKVVDKIIASPEEVKIWGHIPVPALALSSGKVNHVPQYRDSWPTECWQVYPV